MPLVECHAATRARWTSVFTTLSDKKRLRDEGPPHMQCCFRAERGGGKLKKRLLAHLRKRRHPKWVSATTSAKGSYKTPDVLAYLDRHLPEVPAPPKKRPWRIMMADDHGPHLSPQVKRLCWSRSYAFIPHGGGVTPVTQTVDTHLNQHAKREYNKVEGAALLRAMRLGQCVPQLDQTECIDLMVEVMSNMSLHYAAADGYWETGFKANLWDADLDHLICKEAGYFWRKLGMRAKVAAAVAEVKAEVEAGRLRWCYDDIMRLILPHPRRGRCDDVLANLGDGTALDEGDQLWHGMEGADGDVEGLRTCVGRESARGDASEGSDGGDGSASDDAWSAAGDVDNGCDVGLGGPAAAAAGESVVEAPPALLEPGMEAAERTSDLMRTYASMAEEMRGWGDVASAAYMENQLAKERRRVRERSREDPAVQRNLVAYEDAREAKERAERRWRDHEAERKAELRRLGNDVKIARKLAKAQQAKLADAAAAIDLKHQVKRVGLAELGQGRRSCGGAEGRKERLDVLTRLSLLGAGLSAAQKADFDWFKAEWDATGINDFKEKWPETFATWVQSVVDEYLGGNARAFSLFMESETRRCLSGSLALAIPGAEGD